MDLSDFKTDVTASEDGVWIDIDSDASVKVARANNKKFRKRLQQLTAPYKRLIEQDKISDDKLDELLVIALAECVLLDWRGLSVNGENIEYSRENAIKILSDPAYVDFRDYIVSLSQDADVFREKEIEAITEK